MMNGAAPSVTPPANAPNALPNGRPFHAVRLLAMASSAMAAAPPAIEYSPMS